MAGVADEVADGNVLRLGRTISQGQGDGEASSSHVGRHASRGVISPHFANIALNGLDWRSTTPASAMCVMPTALWSL